MPTFSALGYAVLICWILAIIGWFVAMGTKAEWYWFGDKNASGETRYKWGLLAMFGGAGLMLLLWQGSEWKSKEELSQTHIHGDPNYRMASDYIVAPAWWSGKGWLKPEWWLPKNERSLPVTQDEWTENFYKEQEAKAKAERAADDGKRKGVSLD